MIVYGLWAAGAFAIGLGVLPVVAALAALVRPRGEQGRGSCARSSRSTAASLLASASTRPSKAAYLSTVFATTGRGAEPDLPRARCCSSRPRSRSSAAALRWWALAGAGGFVALRDRDDAVPARPLHRTRTRSGFSILQMANRDLAFDDRDVDRGCSSSSLIVSIGLLLGAAIPDAPAAPTVAWAPSPPRSSSSWNLAGQISASNGSNSFSQTLRSNFPSPPNWVDKATGGKPDDLPRPAHHRPAGDLADGVLEPVDQVRLEPGRNGSRPGPVPAGLPHARCGARRPPDRPLDPHRCPSGRRLHRRRRQHRGRRHVPAQAARSGA